MVSVSSDSTPTDSDPIQWLQSQGLRAQEVGRKAAILSNIQTAGMAVPPGFIISPRYFQEVLGALSLPLKWQPYPARKLWQIAEGLQQQVDALTLPPPQSYPQNPHHNPEQNPQSSSLWEQLRGAYTHLRASFPNTPNPSNIPNPPNTANTLYILRPSLGFDLPTTGLLESVVHGMGSTDEERLWLQFCKDLRSLYRQCFQARSLLYWHYHHQPLAEIPLAVLVQPLVPALAAGTIELSPLEISPLEIQVTATGGMGLEAQHQPALSPAQLMILREEARALQALMGDLESLEWVFSPSGTESSLVWIQGICRPAQQTQFATPPSGDRLFPVSDQHISDQTRPEPSRLEHNEQNIQHITVIQGQGVSQGVQRGRVYTLETFHREFFVGDSGHSGGSDDFAPHEDPPIILVGQQLTPEVFPWLTRVRGLVLAQGGLTSHGAILARELQIPAVVGVGSVHLHYLLEQDWVEVDGTEGRVQVLAEYPPIASGDPLPEAIVSAGKIREEIAAENTGDNTGEIIRGIMGSAVPVRIFATLNQVASLGAMPDQPVAGVGLLRSEWFCLDLWDGQHPQRWIAQGRQGELRQRLCDRLQRCIQAIHPRPLFYRSVDCRAAELRSLAGQEVFPWTVGGTFAHCHDPSVLTLEFEVLHRIDRCGSPIHLVLPMVRTVEEFIACRDRYQDFLEKCRGVQEHTESLDPCLSPLPLWVMVEVPSLVLQLPALAEAGIQGLVIGPGDLAHHLLGLDREGSGGRVYDIHHPLVHQVILNLLKEAQHLQLPTLLCCHAETLPQEHLQAYHQAGLWGMTAEIPHLRALYLRALQLTAQPG